MFSWSEKVYSMLLYLYPCEFRQQYGDDMKQLFRDMLSQNTTIELWGITLRDFIPSVITEHLENIGHDPMTTIKIDQYEVKKQITKGATSAIYLVNDPLRQRDVVMKLWQPDGEFDPNTLRREVDVMTQLKHANIPEVYEYVENESHPYFLMEYIPGDSLLKQIEMAKTFIPQNTIITWGVQLCDILIHFHNNKPDPYLFRDVKPSNVIVDDDGNLHLIDFGITVPHIVDHRYDLIGTQGYSAPEQYTGHVDVRSDIYALGASLHHISTRIDPRPEHNVNNQKFTFAPLRSINPKYSKSFASIITKAVAYEPENRFQNINEMKDALLQCAERIS